MTVDKLGGSISEGHAWQGEQQVQRIPEKPNFLFFFSPFATTAILAYVDCEAAGTFANECLAAVLWHTFMGMMNEFRRIDWHSNHRGDMTAADS